MNDAEYSTAHGREDVGGPEADWLIGLLAHIADQGALTLSVTLFVKGTVISGMLIGVKEYFHLFSDDWVEGLSLPNDNDSSEAFLEKGVIEQERAMTSEDYAPKYVHLKNARVINQNMSTPPQGDMLWRGKITEVDGFSVGMLG